MGLSKREIGKIMSRESNKKMLDKGFFYYYLRGLIFIAVLITLFSIPAMRAGSPWYSYLLIAMALFISYSLFMGFFWGLISFIVRTEDRSITKMNINRETYTKVVKEHSKKMPSPAKTSTSKSKAYDVLIKPYQVERLQALPDFRIPENPVIYEKIRGLLGWTELDENQKKNKRQDRLTFLGLGAFLAYLGLSGPSNLSGLTWFIAGLSFLYALLPSSIGGTKKRGNSDSRSIYTDYLHYWNKHFSPIRGQLRDTWNTSFGKQHIFDTDNAYRITIDQCYQASHLVGKNLYDTVSYVYKTPKNTTENEGKSIGILWNLLMPDVKNIGSDVRDNFYLLPEGNPPRMTSYTYYTTREGYDVYITGKAPEKELDHVLELIRPFIKRNWQVGVEYIGGYMYIYIPDFLPDTQNITTEAELLHVCRRVDSFYSFLKRSLYWRYGNIEKWNNGEI